MAYLVYPKNDPRRQPGAALVPHDSQIVRLGSSQHLVEFRLADSDPETAETHFTHPDFIKAVTGQATEDAEIKREDSKREKDEKWDLAHNRFRLRRML